MAHKEDEDSFQDDDVYINAEDGMPNIHPNIANFDHESDTQDEVDDFDDLPKSVIVTNIHSSIFADEKLKKEMEDLFRTFSDNITFQWLRSFKRLRVNYDSPLAAANARIQLHQYQFYDSCINCYFAQPVTPVSLKNLKPPAPFKQFLISPPSSPPVGWEPREEGEPLVNHDLLAALANLSPGRVTSCMRRLQRSRPLLSIQPYPPRPSYLARCNYHTLVVQSIDKTPLFTSS